MNGLPGLFGSSLPETFELQRLIQFLLEVSIDASPFELPIELSTLLREVVSQLQTYHATTDPQRDFVYWDTVATAREAYRASIRFGLAGETRSLTGSELAEALALFAAKIKAGLARALALNGGLPPTYFTYKMTDYALLHNADGTPRVDAQGRPFIRAQAFSVNVLPLFLEGPVHALKVQSSAEAARLYQQIKASPLFDRELKMYKVNVSLADQPPDLGRVRVFTPGWLENESIWLHMEYKYLLEVLRAGLYAEFFEDFTHTVIPFLDPHTYGRSPLENSSFLVSSAHPDRTLHGAGFVARLTGSSAEFLSLWQLMLIGPQPFVVRADQLYLIFKPALPGWLFTDDGTVTFNFLGQCRVTYHNPRRVDTFAADVRLTAIELITVTGERVELAGDRIGPEYAALTRDGQIKQIDVYLDLRF